MSKRTPAERTWTLKEAAADHPLCLQYRLSEKKLRSACQSGKLSHTRSGERLILLTNADIADYIERSRSKAER